MTRFLFDTNICIELLRGRGRGPAGSRKVVLRLRRREIDDIAISSITLAELHYGAAKSARPDHHQMLIVQFCAPIAILPFDHAAAEVYGRIRASLERAGKPIGPLDLLIASQALSLNLTLVTTNEREFKRVEGLRVENWMTA